MICRVPSSSRRNNSKGPFVSFSLFARRSISFIPVAVGTEGNKGINQKKGVALSELLIVVWTIDEGPQTLEAMTEHVCVICRGICFSILCIRAEMKTDRPVLFSCRTFVCFVLLSGWDLQ